MSHPNNTILILLNALHCTKGVLFRALTLLHSERPKLHTILAFLSAIGLSVVIQATAKITLINIINANVNTFRGSNILFCLPSQLGSTLNPLYTGRLVGKEAGVIY